MHFLIPNALEELHRLAFLICPSGGCCWGTPSASLWLGVARVPPRYNASPCGHIQPVGGVVGLQKIGDIFACRCFSGIPPNSVLEQWATS